MLKYTIAIAALLVGAPTAFAQSMHSDKGGPAGMSSSGSGSAGATSGSASHERSGASSGVSEGSSGSDSSASGFAPGHENGSGSAKDLAPGQRMKSEGGSARDYSPGHEKGSPDKLNQRSENKSKDFDRDRAGRGDKSGDRNAKIDRDLKNDRDLKDRNAKNDRDMNDRNAKNDRDLRDKDRGSTGASEGTEGRSEGGRHGSVANVSVEQKTRIRSIFTEHRVEPARDLHVSVNVGTRIPRSIHLYPVPEQVISIVPEYRDYEYILLDDNRVAIIDPDTFEVVDIIILT